MSFAIAAKIAGSTGTACCCGPGGPCSIFGLKSLLGQPSPACGFDAYDASGRKFLRQTVTQTKKVTDKVVPTGFPSFERDDYEETTGTQISTYSHTSNSCDTVTCSWTINGSWTHFIQSKNVGIGAVTCTETETANADASNNGSVCGGGFATDSVVTYFKTYSPSCGAADSDADYTYGFVLPFSIPNSFLGVTTVETVYSATSKKRRNYYSSTGSHFTGGTAISIIDNEADFLLEDEDTLNSRLTRKECDTESCSEGDTGCLDCGDCSGIFLGRERYKSPLTPTGCIQKGSSTLAWRGRTTPTATPSQSSIFGVDLRDLTVGQQYRVTLTFRRCAMDPAVVGVCEDPGDTPSTFTVTFDFEAEYTREMFAKEHTRCEVGAYYCAAQESSEATIGINPLSLLEVPAVSSQLTWIQGCSLELIIPE